MKNHNLFSVLSGITMIAFLLIAFDAISQNPSTEFVEKIQVTHNDENNPCITAEEYRIIENTCNVNAAKLAKRTNSNSKKTLSPALSWPLRQVNALGDCSYYIITNNVDNDNTAGVKDYNCGTRTYNGHRGTDIVPEPYPYYKMDNNQVEVIAAADGTIVAKGEGNTDKNCTTGAVPYQGNYIALEHADGSRTLYYHMKKNSLTTKNVGQTVVLGEFLGIVGSSGSSNIPHLHFEVWSNSSFNSVVDPYNGTCNTLITNSLWANQKPYKETGLLKLQINNVAPILTNCSVTETPNEITCFTPGQTARFYRWIREDQVGLTANMRIINPNGSTFDSWTGAGNTTWNMVLYNSSRTLPSVPGIYTYEAELNGEICTKLFRIDCTLSTSENELKNELLIYPNPFSRETTLEFNSNIGQVTLEIYNSLGQKIREINGIYDKKIIITREGLSNGIYYVKLTGNTGVLFTNKMIIN